MKARDVMTSDVVSVRPDASIQEVAKLLADHRVSAIPVVDANGAPVGMVSEGDLMARANGDRETRRDWWLTLLAEGEDLHPEFLATLRDPAQAAKNVMTSPVVTIGEDTELREIARLLTAHRIKRVPVTRDGRVVGIVSRADLVRALTEEPSTTEGAGRPAGFFAEALAGIDQRFDRLLHYHAVAPPASAPATASDDTHLSATDFRYLVADHEEEKVAQQRDQQRQIVERRRERIAELVDTHISDEAWRALVHKARSAAEAGEKQYMLLRFPSGLCGDGGRAINAARSEWPESLRGEAAEIYRRWERDLKPHGFALAASVLDFPGGMPGDIGMFLVWGS